MDARTHRTRVYRECVGARFSFLLFVEEKVNFGGRDDVGGGEEDQESESPFLAARRGHAAVTAALLFVLLAFALVKRPVRASAFGDTIPVLFVTETLSLIVCTMLIVE